MNGDTPTIDWKLAPRDFYRPWFVVDCVLTQHLMKSKKLPLITVADIGCRGGFDDIWDTYGKNCLQIGFEPDEQEYQQLQNYYKINSCMTRYELEKCALWETDGKQSFYNTVKRGCGSFLEPNMEFYNRLPDSSPMRVEEVLEMETKTLDSYGAERHTMFDVIKIDVQGGELQVLKGARAQLERSTLAVLVEIGFVAHYKKQALFAEVDAFMQQFGFSVFDVDIRRWSRVSLPEPLNNMRVGQIIWGDALYLKDPLQGSGDRLQSQSMNAETIIKLVSLAERFSLMDYAHEILDRSSQIGRLESTFVQTLRSLLNKNTIETYYTRNFKNPGADA